MEFRSFAREEYSLDKMETKETKSYNEKKKEKWALKEEKKKTERLERNKLIKEAVKSKNDEILELMTDDEREKFIQDSYEMHGKRINDQKERKLLKASILDTVYKTKLSEQISVCIDCGFEDKMIEREIKSMSQQISFCYGRNLAEEVPLYLGLCEVAQDSKILKELQKRSGFNNWKLAISDMNVSKMFYDSKKIVYLSADSDTVLDRLESGVCYVIGGIVDRNRYKGLCNDKAKEFGFETARFPLLENVTLTSSCVLATNHCFDIIHELKNGKSWKEALEGVIPARKRVDSDESSIQIIEEVELDHDTQHDIMRFVEK